MARDLSGRRGRNRDGTEKDRPNRGKDYDGEPSDDEVLEARKREFIDWDELTIDDRESCETDRDFYDGLQWTEEEIDELNARGQPVITKNRIFPKINYVLGTETENRTDPRAYPRTRYHDLDAEAVTDALRFVADQDDFDGTRSATAGDLCIEGGPAGGVFSAEGEDFTFQHIFWDRIYYDPHSRKPDFSDARYMGILVWMYRDEAEAVFLDAHEEGSEEYQAVADALERTYQGLSSHTAEDRPRRWTDESGRVLIFESYYRERGGWWQCKWTYAGFLEPPSKVAFRDERGRSWCPMWITSAFVTRENARYGIVRNMISPQEEINKRSSKALHLIHTTRVIAEAGAIPEPDEFIAQRARPDGIAEVAPGTLKDDLIRETPNDGLAAAQLGMLERAEASIDQIGPQASMVAADQRMQSGRLFIARQQAGSMELKPVFDHLRTWTLGAFRRYWWLVRQYWTSEKWLRVTDDEAHTGFRFVAINREMTRAERIEELIEEGQEPDEAIRHVLGPKGVRLMRGIRQHVEQATMQMQQQAQQLAVQAQQTGQPPPQMPPPPDPMALLMQSEAAQESYLDNDVAQLDVDIVLDTTPDSALIRHEQFTELVELVRTSPVLNQDRNVLRVVIELCELRSAEKRRLTSALEPPKPPAPDPAQQKLAQQQMQLALAELQAKVAKLQSETAKNQAQTQAAQIEAQVGVPAAAQLDQAQAALAAARAQAVPLEAQLKNAQAAKTATEARILSAPSTPQGVGGVF